VVKREFAITEQAAKTPAPGGMPASADTPSGAAARNA